ncbi:DUF2267 domain-containing protein [Roseovarius sp. A21]|uniref:DUF2267 domain-containing protein n=1 Tax=Roseovarius bejariae TaxID=2576383 RepID=A0A844CZU8_9RHOB|nr:DUF2267 domain-containing protein [Roseovarius bejariae]MRU16120.1 DUF2267 domain-containing protein [Roseovarius bejariae]
MSSQGLEVIDHTVQLTHEWINELAAKLGWGDRRQVLMLMRTTLAGLRDMLGPNEAAQLSAQLPLLVRGLFFEGWQPAHSHERTREALVARIEANLGHDREYQGPEDISEVFRLLNGRVSEGEVRQARQSLPADIRDLWPEL